MKLKQITEEGLLFDNGTTVRHTHDQDCCESVYADWKQLRDTDVFQHEFNEELELEGVEDSGFKMDGYFVPCYNQQSDYYSDDLEIVITLSNGYKRVIDMEGFIKDDIC